MNSSTVADGLKIENLSNTGHIVERTVAVVDADDLRLDKAVDLRVISSEEEEVPEDKESSNVSTTVLKAEVMGDDGIAECNDNIHNEEDNPESEIIVSRKRSLLETEAGATSENSKRQKLLRAPRYFDPPDCSLPAFKPCKIIYGNLKRKRRKKKKKVCYICARLGHDGKSCPQNQVNNCSICSKKEAENDAEEDNAAIFCLKCGSSDHDMFSCRNEYNPEDLKNIQCYICKEFGHLCCAGNAIEGPSQASCYKCGESGHYGFECTKLNEVANNSQSVSLCSKCKKRVHFQQKWKLINLATSAEIVVKKDAVAVKPVKAKSRKSRRRGRKKKPMPTAIATQSLPNIPTRGCRMPTSGPNMSTRGYRMPAFGPSMSMRGYRMPTFGQYYEKHGSNVWLSPAAAAARNSLGNPAALNLSSYQHMLPPSNYQSGGLPHQNSFNPGTIFPNAFYSQHPNHQNGTIFPNAFCSQHPNHQNGTHLSPHIINRQVEIQVPPNSFDPWAPPPPKIFYHGTQIPGRIQNKVQLPYQNISHQVGTQFPRRTSDSQLPYQNISHQVGTQFPQSTSDSLTQIQPAYQILGHRQPEHPRHFCNH